MIYMMILPQFFHLKLSTLRFGKFIGISMVVTSAELCNATAFVATIHARTTTNRVK